MARRFGKGVVTAHAGNLFVAPERGSAHGGGCGGRYAGRIDLRQLIHVSQDPSEVADHGVDLVIGQTKPGESGNVNHVLAGNGHDQLGQKAPRD